MRCEGWRRHGGSFTFGPVKWIQCKNQATTMLTVKQEKVETLPACANCWKEVIDKKIKIISATPIIAKKNIQKK